MPPKKKSKINKADKEKPLLTVQGVLRLDKSFVPPKNEDAPELVTTLHNLFSFVTDASDSKSNECLCQARFSRLAYFLCVRPEPYL